MLSQHTPIVINNCPLNQIYPEIYLRMMCSMSCGQGTENSSSMRLRSARKWRLMSSSCPLMPPSPFAAALIDCMCLRREGPRLLACADSRGVGEGRTGWGVGDRRKVDGGGVVRGGLAGNRRGV